jgi:hypothetical protein
MGPVALDNTANFRVDIRDVIEPGFNLLAGSFPVLRAPAVGHAEIQSSCPGNPSIMMFVPSCVALADSISFSAILSNTPRGSPLTPTRRLARGRACEERPRAGLLTGHQGLASGRPAFCLAPFGRHSLYVTSSIAVSCSANAPTSYAAPLPHLRDTLVAINDGWAEG